MADSGEDFARKIARITGKKVTLRTRRGGSSKEEVRTVSKKGKVSRKSDRKLSARVGSAEERRQAEAAAKEPEPESRPGVRRTTYRDTQTNRTFQVKAGQSRSEALKESRLQHQRAQFKELAGREVASKERRAFSSSVALQREKERQAPKPRPQPEPTSPGGFATDKRSRSVLDLPFNVNRKDKRIQFASGALGSKEFSQPFGKTVSTDKDPLVSTKATFAPFASIPTSYANTLTAAPEPTFKQKAASIGRRVAVKAGFVDPEDTAKTIRESKYQLSTQGSVDRLYDPNVGPTMKAVTVAYEGFKAYAGGRIIGAGIGYTAGVATKSAGAIYQGSKAYAASAAAKSASATSAVRKVSSTYGKVAGAAKKSKVFGFATASAKIGAKKSYKVVSNKKAIVGLAVGKTVVDAASGYNVMVPVVKKGEEARNPRVVYEKAGFKGALVGGGLSLTTTAGSYYGASTGFKDSFGKGQEAGAKVAKKAKDYKTKIVEKRFEELGIKEKEEFGSYTTPKVPVISKEQAEYAAEYKLPFGTVQQSLAQGQAREAQVLLSGKGIKALPGTIVENRGKYALATYQAPTPAFDYTPRYKPTLKSSFFQSLGGVSAADRAAALASKGQTQFTDIRFLNPTEQARIWRFGLSSSSAGTQSTLTQDFSSFQPKGKFILDTSKPLRGRLVSSAQKPTKSLFDRLIKKKFGKKGQVRTIFSTSTEYKSPLTIEPRPDVPEVGALGGKIKTGEGLLKTKEAGGRIIGGLSVGTFLEPNIKPMQVYGGRTRVDTLTGKTRTYPIEKTKTKVFEDTITKGKTKTKVKLKYKYAYAVTGTKTITRTKTKQKQEQEFKPAPPKPIPPEEITRIKPRKGGRGKTKPKPPVLPKFELPKFELDKKTKTEPVKKKKKKKKGYFTVTPTLFAAARGIKLKEPKKATKTGFTVRGI